MQNLIDHTLLRPEATEAEIKRLCDEAVKDGFYSVCVMPRWVPAAVTWLKGSPVRVVTVVSFPEGLDPTEQKISQTREVVAAGAWEVDMVLNRQQLKSKKYRETYAEIAGVVAAAAPRGVKVILEISELTRDEKILACGLSKAAGAAFVKTSTGFSRAGATEEDVRLMREIVGADMGVKASGGIRTREVAEKMIRAGADRLGTSASVAIVGGATGPGGGY